MNLRDIEIPRRHSPTNISEGLEFFSRMRQHLPTLPSGTLRNTAFITIFENKDSGLNPFIKPKPPIENIGPCHGGLFDTNNKRGCILLGTVTPPPNHCNSNSYSGDGKPDGYDHEAAKAYLTWLVRDSNFARFIVDTSPTQAIEAGIFISADTPSNILAMICIMTRYVREKHGQVRLWHYLREKYKLDGHLAFILAVQFNIVPGQVSSKAIEKQFNPTFMHQGGGHFVFNGNQSIEDIKRFISGEPYHLNKPYREIGSYKDISKTFESSGRNAQEDILRVLNNLSSKSTVLSSLKSPFGKYREPKPPPGMVSTSVFMEHLNEVVTQLWP